MIYFPQETKPHYARLDTSADYSNPTKKKPQRRNITTPLSICIITTEHKIQIFGQNKNV